MYTIQKWDNIKHKYKEGLIIGNGASIAVHQKFNYDSLYDYASKAKLITPALQRIFDEFKTTDFEAILRKLLHAQIVNTALSINDPQIKKAYEDCQHGLIDTIQHIHPEHHEVDSQLDNIAKFLENFKTVVSLNYDLILYWAIERGNQYSSEENIKKHVNRFKDCFTEPTNEDKSFQQNWRFFLKPHSPCSDSTLIFYLHGNLSLANRTDALGEQEVKITSPDSYHRDKIFEKWESGYYSPLFICEGDPIRKLISIKASPYLNTVYYDVLKETGESVAIYGFGFTSHDEHIINQLFNKKTSLKNIAISVHKNNQQFMQEIAKKIHDKVNKDIQIDFYDAESNNCWNNS